MCIVSNHHFTGERREMSTERLPAASLRTGDLFPTGRMLLWISMYLIRGALSSICSSICGARSIFLPEAGKSGLYRRGRDAARSARVVGVLALAQHHPDRSAGQFEIPAQRVDEIAPIGSREIRRLRSEQREARRAGVHLGHVAQAQAAAGDQR